ncbi:MAG TPA: CPBP family intramembrane glutamic endopeptidase [Polyangia bacterium]|nr:CPBP family intramembrane glutamic endopeptidase [Polyangia bacterium]
MVRSSILAGVVALSGPLVWVALSRANRHVLANVPWAAVTMLGLVAVSWWYASGRGPPLGTSTWRRTSFRARWPSRASTPWLLLAILAVAGAAQSVIMLSFRLGHFAPDAFAPTPYPASTAPIWIYLGIIVTSLVAGFFEEAGFRGVMQASLERRYGPARAIVLASALFYSMHLSQGWTHGDLVTTTAAAMSLFLPSIMVGALAWVTDSIVPGIAVHTLIDVISLPIERNLVGHVNIAPVWVTGIDRHFVTCCAFLVISAIGVAASWPRLVRGATR